MLLTTLIIYAVACWTAALAFVAYGLIAYGSITEWTWRKVGRIIGITLAAPVSVPYILVFILAVSRFRYK